MKAKLVDLHPLRRYRIEQGYTLEDTQGLTGYAPSVISRIERWEINPRPATKVKIARRLGEPVGKLFPVEDVDEVEDVDDLGEST